LGIAAGAADQAEVRMTNSVTRHFADLPDPRSPHGTRHSLASLITIVICAVICGAED
jgi:hypothetical protein